MAFDVDNLYIAIRNKLLGNAALSAVVGARVYNLWRPGVDATYPRIDFGQISSNTNENRIHESFWQFSIYDDDRDAINCLQISHLLEAALDWTNYAATGFEVHWCEKLNGRMVGIDDGDIAHWADDYMIRYRVT